MERQVNAITKACYYQLRKLGKIRRFLTTDTCRTLVNATITSRLDYANSLLYGIPDYLMDRLQKVQNSVARFIQKTNRRDHITPVLIHLHWLPVEYRVRYKIILVTYKAIHGTAPQYISDLINKYQPSRNLRSSTQSLLVIPKTRTSTYGKRSFRTAAATLWNSIPESVKTIDSLPCFKTHLKTYLFKLAFDL